MERFTFTVGKLDAGMAILIGERAHLIEFPSILLPPGVTSGSIVNISVNRNHKAESAHLTDFWSLQDEILTEYGLISPTAPELQLRHVTQTSVTLEWNPLDLAKAKVRSLEIFKNGQRLALIPNPGSNTSTKLSSLQSNEEYTFQLVLKTTAGTYPSNIIRVRTHTMTDTSGISVCFGQVDDPILLSQAKEALDHMNAKWTEKIQIDTTHFVCSGPGRTVVEDDEDDEVEGEYEESGGGRRGKPRGASGLASPEYQKAVQMNLPIVQPHWVLACHQDKKLVAISSFQLGATAAIQYVNSARFSRGDSSHPGTPVRRDSMNAAAQAASIARAPSPETIARMSVEPTPYRADNRSQSAKSSTSRSTPTSPTLEAPPHRFGEPQSIGQVTDAYQEPSYAKNSQRAFTPPPASPRSPKPEADGKLDRGFKFPTSDSRPGTPTLPIAGAAVTGSQSSAEKLHQAKEEEGGLPVALPEGSGPGATILEPENANDEATQAIPSENNPSASQIAVQAESAAIDDLINGDVSKSKESSVEASMAPSARTDKIAFDEVAIAPHEAHPAEKERDGPLAQAAEAIEDLVIHGSTKMADFIKEATSASADSSERATEDVADDSPVVGLAPGDADRGLQRRPEAKDEIDPQLSKSAAEVTDETPGENPVGQSDTQLSAEAASQAAPAGGKSVEANFASQPAVEHTVLAEAPAPLEPVAQSEHLIEDGDRGMSEELADEDEDDQEAQQDDGAPEASGDPSSAVEGASGAKKGKKKKGGKGKKK